MAPNYNDSRTRSLGHDSDRHRTWFLYEDFDTTTTSLLEIGDQTINEVQSILQLKKAKNLNKRAIGATRDLAMVFRDRDKNRKASTNDKCYNCHKFGHFSRDCSLLDKRLNRIQHSQRDSGLRKSGSQTPSNRNNSRSDSLRIASTRNSLRIPNGAH